MVIFYIVERDGNKCEVGVKRGKRKCREKKHAHTEKRKKGKRGRKKGKVF